MLWQLTGSVWQGNRVYSNPVTGELAQEIIQEGRLVDLPPSALDLFRLATEPRTGVSIGRPVLDLQGENETWQDIGAVSASRWPR